MLLFIVVGDCSCSLTVVPSSNTGRTVVLLVADEEVPLVNGDVELSTSVLEDFNGCVNVHLSVNGGGVVFGTSTVGVLGSELLFCQGSAKVEADVTAENEVLVSFPIVVASSVVFSGDVVTVG